MFHRFSSSAGNSVVPQKLWVTEAWFIYHLLSLYVVTEWKMVHWESILYSYQGQDNFLG